MLHHMGHAHGQTPRDTERDLENHFARAWQQEQTDTESWRWCCGQKLSEWSSHLHMDNNLNMLKITGLYGWCKDKRNLAGLWPFLTVQGRWILPPFHSKVWLHHVYNINTDKKATGIHQHGLPLEFTMYSMTHSISQISGEDSIYITMEIWHIG